MTTNYPSLPLPIAYLVDFVRRSYGWGPKPTVNLCEAFHTIFWGLFPVPSALVARLLRFVFGHGRFGNKKAKKIGQALFYFLIAVFLIGSTYGHLLKHGWWAFLISILITIGLLIVVLILLIAGSWGAWLLFEYLKNRKAERADASGESVSPRRETPQTVAVVWHYIVSLKRHLCPIYTNPLYRESAKD